MNAPSAAAPELVELAPIGEQERLAILDVLRGFAIFGILLVNMHLFFAPVWEAVLPGGWFPSALDRGVRTLVVVVAQAKFYTLFSFLFGLGLAIQLRRAEARGASIARYWARRMTILLALGLAHGLLLWFGDILALYALLGYPLLLFRRARPRTLLLWSGFLLLVPLVVGAGLAGLLTAIQGIPEVAARLDASAGEMLEQAEAARRAYADGGYDVLFAMRVRQWGAVWSSILFGGIFANVLAVFVLGLWAGRERLFEDLGALGDRMRRMLAPVAAVALVTNVGAATLARTVDQGTPSFMLLGQQALLTIGAPALCFTYVAVIVLLYRGAGRAALDRLAPVGRMALTNYLAHSIVLTTAANFYGLGLYGRVSPAAGLGLTIGVFAVQLAASPLWLARFRFGPAEWLWRSLSYGRLQPLIR